MQKCEIEPRIKC